MTAPISLPSFSALIANPRLFLALGFGSGLAPKAPGTAGTLMAVPLYLLLQQLPLAGYVATLLLAALVGIYLCDYAGKYLGVSDHGAIVWDEFVGYWLAMLFAPKGFIWVLYGFVLFRLFDIWKPWPIGWADKKVKGGFGVMLDDVLAGLMALLVIQLTVISVS
ncbi:phosphatidylglycerophosphatase A [Simiduia curdlanivorans]|nr:phosphatidylglycerophosphatase A [Simiduia curdlanivorans]MDN3637599.1 phosphatidylglycerophosphatase A [Simiduia curdlanivorans]